MDDPRPSPPGERATATPAAADAPVRPGDELAARRDEALVARALDGDLGAFNQLVEAYQDLCHALVARLVPDVDQASDAVQEAFFSAYRNLRSYRGPSFRGWLTRIAVNAAMDLQRARRRRPVGPYPELEDDSWQPPAGPDADPEAIVTASERGRALATALAAIAADQRTAIVLYDVEGYDYGEIAELTGVSLGTVKSRIHRGRLALRAILAERMELFHH
ncbi:MAG: sigma-70 family RNA polymerase sigma factor [Chloroflexi bacterium]|nr:sigma-70 family RNA polymerase sigma factor [Chloroflexota bacterium]